MNSTKHRTPSSLRAVARRLLSAFALSLVTPAAFAGTNLTIQLLSEFVSSGAGPNYPYGRLVQGTNGDFYGTTYSGGVSNKGTVFKLTSTGTWSTLFSFSGTNGANPSFGGLMLASDGNFYGNCYVGGVSNKGSLFRISHSGSFSNLFSFRNTNGSSPNGWLAQGTDGSFYGTTFGGGTSNMGTIYRMTPAGVVSSLLSFKGTNGANPYAGLTAAGDGNFYGTTYNGGSNDLGTIFRVSTNGVLNLLVSFTGTNGAYPGSGPRTGLALGSDGHLYGTTEYGGPTDDGTVFRVTTNGVFTNLFSFSATNGYSPFAGVVEGPDGNFYGTTSGGSGVSSNGTAFRISHAGMLETVVFFDYTNGPSPIGDLALGRDGNFYGSTVSGGYDGVGALFRLVSPPVITQITKSNVNVTIIWNSFTNGSYQVEYKPNLNSAAWTPLAPTVVATNNSAAKSDSAGDPERYYRVTLLP